jgi:hypothetical protein
MPQVNFRAGEVVTWTARGDDPTDPLQYRENRPVFFVAFEDAENALISYGLKEGAPRHVRVPVNELSRVAPEAPDPTYLPNGVPFATPRAAVPLSGADLEARISTARHALSEAHARAAQAREKVTAAKRIADRGDGELTNVSEELRALNLHDGEVSTRLEAALRAGRQLNDGDVNHSASKSALEARYRAVEVAAGKFNQELARANHDLAASLDEVKTAARGVISALISREAQTLHSQIEAVCRKHSELVAVSAVRFGNSINPLALDRATGELLANGVLAFKEHPAAFGRGQDFWSARWQALFDRLLDGECDAELSSLDLVK